jgi:hypothetical protein
MKIRMMRFVDTSTHLQVSTKGYRATLAPSPSLKSHQTMPTRKDLTIHMDVVV